MKSKDRDRCIAIFRVGLSSVVRHCGKMGVDVVIGKDGRPAGKVCREHSNALDRRDSRVSLNCVAF